MRGELGRQQQPPVESRSHAHRQDFQVGARELEFAAERRRLRAEARQRGALVRDCVTGDARAGDRLDALAGTAHEYGPFNLVLWDGRSMAFAGNQTACMTAGEMGQVVNFASAVSVEPYVPVPAADRRILAALAVLTAALGLLATRARRA